MLKTFHASLFGFMILFVACGKEQKVSGSNKDRGDETTPIEMEKQTLVCEDGVSCPNFIAKIVSIAGSTQRFCTGTLISPSIVMTSTSCLPAFLRSPDIDCSRDVFLFFHKNDDGAPQRVGCKQILQVSSLMGESNLTWRDDVAFIEIDKKLYGRRQLAITREGMSDEKSLEQVSIDQVDQYKAIIRRKDCSVVFKSFINPLADDISSPNAVVTGCDFKNGTTGAPLLDRKGRVRGLISQGMSADLRNYVMNSGLGNGQQLKSISHATNFACAPTIYDNYQLNEEECMKSLTIAEVDRERNILLDPQSLFALNMKDVKKEISENDFIDFGIRLVPTEKDFTSETYPVCFKNVSSWIKKIGKYNEFHLGISTRKVLLKRLLNPDGKVVPFQSAGDKVDLKVYFSPKALAKTHKSYVTLVDSQGRTDYKNLEACTDQ